MHIIIRFCDLELRMYFFSRVDIQHQQEQLLTATVKRRSRGVQLHENHSSSLQVKMNVLFEL